MKMPGWDKLTVAIIAAKTYRIATLQKELKEDYRDLKERYTDEEIAEELGKAYMTEVNQGEITKNENQSISGIVG